MSSQRLLDFGDDIRRARDLAGLGQAIGNMTNGLVNATDLYRAALVQGVSAWDRYIHGIVLDRAVDMLLGRRPVGATTRFGVPLSDVAALMKAPSEYEREMLAKSILAQRLGKETYQRPDDVANALAMVGVGSIWSTAFPSAESAKLAIGVIVNRRNKIVHQCDYDPATPDSSSPLSDFDALDALAVIEKTVSTIDKLCA